MNKYKVKINSRNESTKGFSAIELLVTLFIALLFLSMGYTLYGAIVTSSTNSRQRSQADNIAFEYLRRYEATVAVPCVTSTPINGVLVTGSPAAGLSNPRVTVNITCPNSTQTALSLVKVTVTYTEGGSTRNVYHEVFASTE